MTDKLKLVARRALPGEHPGGPMVPDFEAQAMGQRSFIGRRLDPTKGVEFYDDVAKVKRRHAVFVPLEGDEAIVEKPCSAEYLKALHPHRFAGHHADCMPDLLPGDVATAQLAGVPFDPTFRHAAAAKVGSVTVDHDSEEESV